MGTMVVKETVNGGKEYRTHVDVPAGSFTHASVALHEWLWLFLPQSEAVHMFMMWMRGEIYADHSVSIRYYMPGVGHWFEALYVA